MVDLKKIVRARMAKTGEAYSAARATVLRKKQRSAAPAPAAEDTSGFAQLAGMSDESVRAKTDLDWAQWVSALDALGARTLTHREIAREVGERWPQIGGWWAQTVTVGYERIRGLRLAGQDRVTGLFTANKSRTLRVSAAAAYAAFSESRRRNAWWKGDPLALRSSRVGQLVRFDVGDGTRVEISFIDKGPNKTTLTIAHTKLRSAADIATSKEAWDARLTELSEHLARHKRVP